MFANGLRDCTWRPLDIASSGSYLAYLVMGDSDTNYPNGMRDKIEKIAITVALILVASIWTLGERVPGNRAIGCWKRYSALSFHRILS